ncbi:MAG TPA: hypothetical protein VM266_05695 [Solirubrobacteraceae bacterium]|nr:hypothetical protein [Solirubrobacteraceae bacterium]
MSYLAPRLAFACLLLLVAAAGPARAQSLETEMLGTDNFSHVTNLQYEQRYDSGGNHGSDIEFFDITVDTAAGTPPPAAAPVGKVKGRKTSRAARRAAARARKAYARCAKQARRKKGAKRRAALRKCRKQRARALTRARRAAADVDPTAAGVQRTFAFAGTYYNGLQIVDVSDPETPRIVANYDCAIAQGDVQVFRRDDLGGRVFVGYGADDPYSNNTESACYQEAAELGFDTEENGNSGTFIIDVTDPHRPRTVSFVPFEKGSHNLTIHPSGKYLYNSNSDTIATLQPGIEVADITDLSQPKEVAVVPLDYRPGLGSESHDISFSADGTRAYSAAVSQGVILDTSNPAAPTVVSTIFDPSVNVWHQAEVVQASVPGAGERTLLIGADEFAGATPTGQCPNGGLHVYDVTGPLENAPVKLGYWNFDEVRATEGGGGCTAHVFQLWREQNIMLIANYNGGAHVLDIAALAGLGFGGTATANMVELGRARFRDSNLWAVKSARFDRKGVSYLFGNDGFRGLDVFRFDGAKPSLVNRGRWYPAGSEPTAARLGGAAVAPLLLRVK